ncbi:nicotinate (nicotinamide) nucleotide adenylyltransferase [Oleidesulfovibrio sp.]|uniref:nicotinate (nicotinamide) nucleotide adenylyltransferase n=1 Tax=Oleidesulfovibrio sp. TaxID=2909707 RepID=UPI003A881487
MYKTALFGGTFNPPHIGHLRLLIEVREALGLDGVEVLPCSVPPHKNIRGILPFEIRCAMLNAMVAPFQWATVNTIEGQRQGPSYTLDTLKLLTEERKAKMLFVLGAEDFPALPQWHKGTILPDVSDLLIVTRGTDTMDGFLAAIEDWPDGKLQQVSPSLPAVQKEYMTASGGRVLYLPIPMLEISASLIRERWLQRRCLAGLIPESVLDIMEKHEETIRAEWLE